ncbi:97 kDa heat shock protein [Frankliniella fusca]|uniref:97 kDa heat shock protein n=1 Tax=Frankliniella fusca TaxID=407009 RepID=A0AAE1LKB2_9NEOP|nr:97 kDa heat shock protein [Frankliniella fusca]
MLSRAYAIFPSKEYLSEAFVTAVNLHHKEVLGHEGVQGCELVHTLPTQAPSLLSQEHGKGENVEAREVVVEVGSSALHAGNDVLDGGVGAGDEPDDGENGEQTVLDEEPLEGGARGVVPEGAELDEGGQHDAHHGQREGAHQRDEGPQVGDGHGEQNCRVVERDAAHGLRAVLDVAEEAHKDVEQDDGHHAAVEHARHAERHSLIAVAFSNRPSGKTFRLRGLVQGRGEVAAIPKRRRIREGGSPGLVPEGLALPDMTTLCMNGALRP